MVSRRLLNAMGKSQVIILVALECISLALIVNLWRRKRKMPAWQRCAWSVVLLVPLFGWLFYGFNAINPEAQSEELPERWGSNAPPGS